MTEGVLVLAYGTLRRSGWNHGHYLTDSEFISLATVPGRLYVDPQSSLPFLLPPEREGDRVVGEVYRVGLETLVELDWLEGDPEQYTRSTVLATLSDGREIEVQAYLYFHEIARMGLEQVASGDWLDAQNKPTKV